MSYTSASQSSLNTDGKCEGQLQMPLKMFFQASARVGIRPPPGPIPFLRPALVLAQEAEEVLFGQRA